MPSSNQRHSTSSIPSSTNNTNTKNKPSTAPYSFYHQLNENAPLLSLHSNLRYYEDCEEDMLTSVVALEEEAEMGAVAGTTTRSRSNSRRKSFSGARYLGRNGIPLRQVASVDDLQQQQVHVMNTATNGLHENSAGSDSIRSAQTPPPIGVMDSTQNTGQYQRTKASHHATSTIQSLSPAAETLSNTSQKSPLLSPTGGFPEHATMEDWMTLGGDDSTGTPANDYYDPNHALHPLESSSSRIKKSFFSTIWSRLRNRSSAAATLPNHSSSRRIIQHPVPTAINQNEAMPLLAAPTKSLATKRVLRQRHRSRFRRKIRQMWRWIVSPYLGTFAGSFVPSLLQFLGVVFWIRLPKLVGYGGILGCLLAFLLSYFLSIISMTAFAALVSNEKIPHGPTGVYYILSRNSAAVVGGSLGILLFFANFLSASFYLVGFGNSFVEFVDVAFQWRGTKWHRYLFDSVAWLVICLTTLLGKRIFTKAFVLIFFFSLVGIMIIFGSLCTIRDAPTPLAGYTGLSWDTLKSNWMFDFGPNFSSKDLISLVLPTLAGLTAAANLSGDLRTPYPSYHRGTITSIVSTCTIYTVGVFLLGASVDRETLKNHTHLMAHIPWPGTRWIVAAGMFLIMLSSVIVSLIGAGRVLHSMACDGFFPLFLRPFRFRFKRFLPEPIPPIIFIYFMVQLVLTIFVLLEVSGTRDGEEILVLARFISTIYLLSFAFTNLNVFMLNRSGAPNFRPLFRFHSWQLNLFGFCLCLVIMFIVNTVYASIAVALLIVLFTLLSFTAPHKKEWGNLIQAVFYHQARKYLLLLEEENVKFWRLQLLLVLDSKDGHDQILKFCNFLKKGGLYMLGHVVEGNFVDRVDVVHREKEAWEQRCREQKLKAFSQVSVAHSVRKGIQQLILMSGLGHMKPNTIVLGMYGARNILNEEISPTQQKSARIPVREYVKIIRDILNLQKNLMVYYGFDHANWSPPKGAKTPFVPLSLLQNPEKRYVDIYPLRYTHLTSEVEMDSTISMIIQIASILVNSHHPWTMLKLRICSVVESELKVKSERAYLKKLLRFCRIQNCDIKVTVLKSGHFRDLESASASISSDMHAELGSLSFLFDNLNLRDKYRLINTVIKENVSNTRVVFVPLPEAPTIITEEKEDELYIDCLRVMCNGFGANGTAMMMVYGSQSVISLKHE